MPCPKQILSDQGIIKETEPETMRRAVAFCETIVNSKKITDAWNNGTGPYISGLPEDARQLANVQRAKPAH